MRRLVPLLTLALLSSSCAFVSAAGDCGGTELIAEFEQVGDLVKAATVQSADVEIGSVTDIKLDKENWLARVTMCVDEGERISADARAIVRTTSLLGEKFIDLNVADPGPPYLSDGAVIPVERTGKAAELEDVFAKLAAVLGTGNLEQLNRFTTAQAKILEDHTGDFKRVLKKLHRFTGLLAERRKDISAAVDALDATARRILLDSGVLERFLDSFADSSTVLASQRDALGDLLLSLDRFTEISVKLLDATEDGLNKQFDDLRPVLRTLVVNSRDLAATLKTLGTFTQWFPESMPGDYLQLDVCQAPPDYFGPGDTCPQAEGNDDPGAAGRADEEEPNNAIELIFRRTMQGARR